MIRETYVVLRYLYGSDQGHYGGIGDPGQPTGLVADSEQLDSVEAQDVREEKDVIGLCRAMPLKLIEPAESGNGTAKPTPGPTWGVKAVGAETAAFDGTGITVAVLDTGIDQSHPAFDGMDIVQEDFTGEGNGDTHGHGTHCAATVAGRDVNGVRIGVARGVKRLLIGKVLGKGGAESQAIVDGVTWAARNGANVISMSIGIDFPGYVKKQEKEGVPTELATTRALEGYLANIQLFEQLSGLVGVERFYPPALIVTAAGNESKRGGNPPYVIAASPPAVARGFLSVAALAEGPAGLTVSPFSNTGAAVSGPGSDVLSAALRGGLTSKSGTSMATPHVAGVAAMWAQEIKAGGKLTADLLRSRLIGSAVMTGLQESSNRNDVGAGLVRAPQPKL